MVESSGQLNRVFAALSDPTRRATLARLAEGSASVGELAAPFEISAAAFSKHLRVLREAGLVTKELEGRRHRCSLRASGLRAASEWLTTYQRFWSDSLDALASFLESEPERSTDD